VNREGGGAVRLYENSTCDCISCWNRSARKSTRWMLYSYNWIKSL